MTAEPGERRRVRYRLRSAPMRVAQQFLAALARDWDGPLEGSGAPRSGCRRLRALAVTAVGVNRGGAFPPG